MADHPPQFWCSCCLWVLMIISVGLFGGAFKTLTPVQCGLKINSITQQISTTDPVFTSGRYFIGLGNTFLVYPTTLDNIDFSPATGSSSKSLRASTSEGQSVVLEISFQFRLKIGQLQPLYRRYANNYKGNFVTIAESAIKNLVSQRYNTIDYFTSRKQIGEVLHAALNVALGPEFAVVEHFQLRDVSVPASTDSQILLKLIKQQQVVTATVQQNSSLVRASTTVIQSQANQQVLVVNAEADKTATIVTETANAQAVGISVNATAQSYKILMDELGFTREELLQYLYYENIRLMAYPSALAVDVPAALFSQGRPTKPIVVAQANNGLT